MLFHQMEDFLHIKGENQQNEETTYRRYLQTSQLTRDQYPECIRNSTQQQIITIIIINF